MTRSATGILAILLAAGACGRGDSGEPPRDIPSPAPPGSTAPNLAVDPEGRVVLSWVEPADTGHRLRFAMLDGDTWGPPRTVASGQGWFVNWADFPSLLPLGGGGLVAHWLVRHGDARFAYDVTVSRTADGGVTWTAPAIPHTDATATEHGFAALWPEADGSVGLAWLDGRRYAAGDDRMTLRLATLDTGGAPRGEAELDDRVCDCCQVAAAVTDDGPVVVYRDRTSAEVRDIHVVRRVAGRWTAPAAVAADHWIIPQCPVNGPAIAARGRTVVVAWFTQSGGQAHVYAARSDDAAATFGRRVLVDDGRPLGRVDVALDGNGATLVSWMEEVDGGAEVRLRRVEDGPQRAAAVLARTSAGRASGFPRIVVTGDRLVAAWTVPGDPGTASAIRTATLRLR